MTDGNDLPVGDIQFYDNYLPSLDAGQYTITAQQDIRGIDTQGFFQPITQSFEVRGPQFVLNPTDIHNVYPPENSSGIYGKVLPHIVLNSRMLPWERILIDGDKTVPWLVILVFQEDELTIDTQTHSPLLTSTVAQLLAPSDTVLKPAIGLDNLDDEVKNMSCQSIIISSDLFRALAPRQDSTQGELSYLAHVRQVDTGNQEISGIEDHGWFSVVTANRFPKSGDNGAKNYAMLVSLEGLASCLTSTATMPKPQVQLVILKSWAFESVTEKGESFAQLMENFVQQEGSNPQNLMLRLPGPVPGSGTAPADQAAERLWNGYVPISFHTQAGVETFAWYRGPFVPVIPQKLPKSVDHFRSSSEAMIYDRNYGLFDHSYSAAWGIGRAIALSSQSFCVALMRFRRNAHQLINRLIERLESEHLETVENLRELLQNNLIKQKFDLLIQQGMGGQLTNAFENLSAATAAAASAPLAPPRILKQAAPGGTPVEVLRNLLARPDVQELMQQEVQTDLQPVAEWLAGLNLLCGIPFNHLVVSQRMLPVESLRFFYIDENWIDSLIDGALTVGVAGSRDTFFHQIMKGVIDDAVNTKVQTLRGKIAGVALGEVEAGSAREVRSGFLIRSAVVSGWPGLMVKGYKNEQQLKLLRLDRPSPEVLLAIFLDIPDKVVLSEPQQGLRFGVEDGDVIQLRGLSAPVGKPLGKPFPTSGGFSRFTRPVVANGPGQRVLNLHASGTSLLSTLASALGVTTLTPADFAIQMVKAPEQLSFNKG